jgi:hypothetical protein
MSRKLAGGLFVLLLCISSQAHAALSAADYSGYGGIGFYLGGAQFTGDQTVAQYADPRLTGGFVFSYGISSSLVADFTVGWAWSRLDSNDPRYYTVAVVPIFTPGLRYMLRDGKRNRPYIGAGGGAYNWFVQTYDLGAAVDPITNERLRRVDWGVYGLVGVTRQMSPKITMIADGVYNYVFSSDTQDFPSGYNGNMSYFELRLGVTFWFSLSTKVDTGLPE